MSLLGAFGRTLYRFSVQTSESENMPSASASPRRRLRRPLNELLERAALCATDPSPSFVRKHRCPVRPA